MADKPAGEKSEKPTQKRLKDARREGQIARTNDLGGWLAVLAASWVLPLTIRWGFEQSHGLFTDAGRIIAAGEGDVLGFLGDAAMRGVVVMAPMAVLAMVLGVLSQVLQIGWAPKKMKPDFKTLNALKGIKQMLSPKLFWDSAKNSLKLVAITAMAIGPLRDSWETLVASGAGLHISVVAGVIAEQAVAFLRNVALLGLVIAAADYVASKRRTDKQVKMTKQEVKEETKQQEGDPHIKGQRRARQLAMSRNRMMAEVPKADVVLVNPTHIAVALRYEPTRGAPIVVAKGAGAIADRIRALAVDADVPIVRDIPLARTTYRICEVGGYIPTELYEAVARILAFVFTLQARGRASGTHDSPFAEAHQPLVDMIKPRPERRSGATVPA